MPPTCPQDLATLIAFPTVSSRPVTAIAAFLAERFEAMGFSIERFDDPRDATKTNVVCAVGPADTDGLVLSGHMDVVPTEGQPWTSDPFVMRTLANGRLVGRGTADMKGFIAACLSGISRLDLRKLKRQIVLVWTHDEEVGCHGSAHLAQTLQLTGRKLPSACWIGEPTEFQILRQHAGHVGVEIALTGAAAHSAYPDLGANAIVAAGRAVNALDELAAHWRQSYDGPRGVPLNIGNIGGGAAINIVPDRCIIQLGFRPLPGMGHEGLVSQLQRCLDDVRLPDGTALKSHVLRVTPSLQTREGTPLQTLLSPHAAVQETGTAGYATDGGNLARVGCEPLIYGPGSIQVAHQADEYIDTAALLLAADQVEAVIRSRCY